MIHSAQECFQLRHQKEIPDEGGPTIMATPRDYGIDSLHAIRLFRMSRQATPCDAVSTFEVRVQELLERLHVYRDSRDFYRTAPVRCYGDPRDIYLA